MGITRKSLFGFPPAPRQGSEYTQRMVPLSSGVKEDVAWPLLETSVVSMTNFLPLNGVLQPRSGLTSVNTIRSLNSILGLTPLIKESGTVEIWASNGTCHGYFSSNGSISRASFVSSFGLGIAGLASINHTAYQYVQTFWPDGGDQTLIAAGMGSYNTLYLVGLDGGIARYSYLTSAPKAQAVAAFDNYILAFNVQSGTDSLENRVQWCVRGVPSNWTGEGSGFEDLLAMSGAGTGIIGTTDNRLLLFTASETWYGVSAAYPAQFTFYPLDKTVGCVHPLTMKDTPLGVVFLGSDNALRIFPHGGGASQILSTSLAKTLRHQGFQSQRYWATYDGITKMYYLFLTAYGFPYTSIGGVVCNVATGEWGFLDYPGQSLTAGCHTGETFVAVPHQRLFFGNSTGTVQSTSSRLFSPENGSTNTATWRSAPIASDLPGNYKQLTEVDIDYRATSKSTITLKVSQDGGNTFESSGRSVILSTAAIGGRATSQMYVGGAFPAIELTSTSTGYELHRLDVTMTLGGRRSG